MDGCWVPGRVVDARSRQVLVEYEKESAECAVKAIDGRDRNGQFWVFFGSLSNVEFELTVTDTVTGLEKVYENPLGEFSSVGDTQAF